MPLGKRTDFGDARYAGLDVPFTSRVEETLESAEYCGFDFIVAPLADPSRRPPPPLPSPDGTLLPPFLPHQVMHTMASALLSNQIVGRISTWIDPDSSDAALCLASTTALRDELAWAAHLTVQACLLPPPPRGARSPMFARAVNHAIVSGYATMALWIQIPACAAKDGASKDGDKESESKESDNKEGNEEERKEERKEDAWEWWNAVRFACNHSTRLGVALEIGPDLPEEEDLARWWGEPVRAVILQTGTFLTNKRGYPTLSKRHQEVLAEALKRNIQVILSSGEGSSGSQEQQPPLPSMPPPPPPPPVADGFEGFPLLGSAEGGTPANTHPMRVYWEYLSYVFRKQPAVSEQEALEAPYRDFLQAPLQPLQDNLESQTYETFERDSTKYEVYGEAVRRALLDRVPESVASVLETVLMVVGAGRGPIVAASLAAGRAAGRRLRVYAVEKNPNAVVHLHARSAAEGWEGVTIIHADMRDWKAPEPADILVSELLGSFGDNELSPECLDGAQRFLKPDGISIPSSYTSFLQPVTAHKLWTDVNAYDDLEHFETPFVVKIHRVAPLAPSQEVFTFVHPNKDNVIDNTRAISLQFKCTPPAGTVCHGFAGYFDAELYKDVHLSIHPDTHTPKMFSWFPIYFPLRQPFYVPAKATIDLSMWRCGTAHKVWYEWAVGAPVASPVHNPDGRSYFVGL